MSHGRERHLLRRQNKDRSSTRHAHRSERFGRWSRGENGGGRAEKVEEVGEEAEGGEEGEESSPERVDVGLKAVRLLVH